MFPGVDGALPLPVMLGDLAAEGATGELVVVAGETERSLFLREGLLVQARSRVADETLGRLLVNQGWIDAETLTAALAEVAEGRQLGEVLISSGALDAAGVVEALTEQVRVRFLACLRLRTFEADFRPGVEPPTHFQVKLKVPDLVMEAVAQVFSLERVLHELGLEAHTRVRLAEPAPPASGRPTLGTRETRVLRRIGTGVVLEDLVREGDVSYLHLLRLIYGLWALRQVVVETVVPEPAPEPPAAPVALDVTDPEDPARVARRRRLLERFQKVSREPTPAPLPPDPEPARRSRGTGDPVQDEILRTWLALGRQSYFELLGVPPTARTSDVKIGYGGLLRRLSLEAPPEAWPERVRTAAAGILDRAAEAYAVLSNAETRKAYRAQLKAGGPRQVVDKDPLLVAGIALHRAERLRGRGRHAEAAQVLREAADGLAHPVPGLSLALGVTLYEWTLEGGRMEDEAARRLAEAVRLDPALDEAWLYLGRLARHQKQPELARRMFVKAVLANRQSSAVQELKNLEGAKGGRSGLLDRLFGKGR